MLTQRIRSLDQDAKEEAKLQWREQEKLLRSLALSETGQQTRPIQVKQDDSKA